MCESGHFVLTLVGVSLCRRTAFCTYIGGCEPVQKRAFCPYIGGCESGGVCTYVGGCEPEMLSISWNVVSAKGIGIPNLVSKVKRK